MNAATPVARARFALKRTGLAVVAAAVLLGGCKQELYANLSENEAAQMWALLLDSGIAAEKFSARNERFGLRVDESHVADAVRVLGDCGLPSAKFEDIGELFRKEGLISSPREEQARFIHGIAQGLSETLTQIDGVITARVHVVVPENNPFADDLKASSASVFIKQRAGASLDDIKTSIKLIVAKSIEGLAYDEVTVAIVSAAKDNACARARHARGLGVDSPARRDSGPSLLPVIAAGLLGMAAGAAALGRRAVSSAALAGLRALFRRDSRNQ